MSASRSTSGARRMRVAVVEERDILRRGLAAGLAEDDRVDVVSAASADALDLRDVDLAVVSRQLARRHRFPCRTIVYDEASMTLAQLQARVRAAAAGLRAVPRARPEERRAIGYVCVSLGTAGSELATYSEAIRTWAEQHSVLLTSIVHDVEREPGEASSRPALRGALERIAAREADTLITASLAHLSPSVAKLRPILRALTTPGRSLVAIDLQLDTATEAGRLAAVALTDIAGWEHERLSARTRRGLQAARARGFSGGRASVSDVPELRERIERMRAQGMTLQGIADVLNEEGVPTLRGGAKWRPSSVQRAAGYRRPPSRPWSIALPDSSRPGDDDDDEARSR